jgi:hypothetical protein
MGGSRVLSLMVLCWTGSACQPTAPAQAPPSPAGSAASPLVGGEISPTDPPRPGAPTSSPITASAPSTTEHAPTTDEEKVADALRAAPKFITDGATIVDFPANKGGDFRVLRQGSSEWTCLPGPTPGSKHDDPGCFDKVFFQFIKDVLAGRPEHVERLGVAYMYTGHTVPSAAGGQFRVGPHIMLVTPHPEDLQGFTRYGWNGTYTIHLPGADRPGQWFLVMPL